MPISNKKGFSFIEAIIAISISIILMVSATATFAKLYGAYRSAKAIEKNLENAQYTMNLMAKSMRTSSIVKCNNGDCNPSQQNYPDEIKFYNYSDGGKCTEYKKISLGGLLKIQAASFQDPDPANTTTPRKDWCKGYDLSALFSDVTDINANRLQFSVVTSNAASNPKVVGRVTIMMEICSSPSCAGSPNDNVKIQSSVSLRDYNEILY